MNGSKICIFEQRNEVSLGSFLQRHHGRRLESEISLHNGESIRIIVESQTKKGGEATHFEILRNLANEPLEGKFPNEEFCRLLVPSDLT